MPRRLDRDQAAVVAELAAALKSAKGSVVEGQRLRREARRQRLAQDAAHDAREGRIDERELRRPHARRRAHVRQPVDMVAVVVREDYLRDVIDRDTRGGERGG